MNKQPEDILVGDNSGQMVPINIRLVAICQKEEEAFKCCDRYFRYVRNSHVRFETTLSCRNSRTTEVST